MEFDHPARLRRLRSRLADHSLDGLLVAGGESIYYLSGFSGSDSLLLVTGDRAVLVTDFRYREQAEEELAPGCEPRLRSSAPLIAEAAALIRERGLDRIGVEEDRLSWAAYRRLEEELSGKRLVAAGRRLSELRMIKDPAEISRIRNSAVRTGRILTRFRDCLKPGRSESSFSRRLAAAFYRAGGSPAFAPIVAAGAHSSHPHAAATDRRIGEEGICLVDLGGKWSFYNADLTRTLVGGSYPRRFKTVYRAVLAAQETALRAIRPGVRADAVDRAAREVLAEKGYGEYFGHGLGHGIGLEVHEPPAVNARSREILREGMVITVEPGVYLPGWGGIRIEDTVLVTAGGCQVLTSVPKTLESCLLKW